MKGMGKCVGMCGWGRGKRKCGKMRRGNVREMGVQENVGRSVGKCVRVWGEVC